uniref:Cytochrome P450 n=1 Tax=Glossina brevipalpis TaxID=37001 RepID=A0A1A9W2A2_9MUSC
MFWTTILFISLCLVIRDFIHKQCIKSYLNKYGLTGSKLSLPLIGDVLLWLGSDITKFFTLYNTFRINYGKVCHFWIFNKLILIVEDVQYLEAILRSSRFITKHSVYNILRNWLNDGLLISTGSKWHTRRKIITPAFHFGMLEKFLKVFDQQSEIFVKSLQTKADGKTVIEMFSEVCLTTLNIIAETAMGVKIDTYTNPNFPYTKAVASLKSFFPDTEEVTHQQLGIKKPTAFLDILLQSTIDGKLLSNEDIREEVDTFMFEGHHTIASGIAYTCYLLSRHPIVQQKAYEEVQRVLEKSENEPIKMKDLQALKYLECVIKETLRLYPSVPLIGRTLNEEFKIGRDLQYFLNPDAFLPERFLSDATDRIHPFTFLPFSAGSRNCIGQKFAMLEMKMIIGKILRNYELLPLGHDAIPAMNLILHSTTGINVGLSQRVHYKNL